MVTHTQQVPYGTKEFVNEVLEHVQARLAEWHAEHPERLYVQIDISSLDAVRHSSLHTAITAIKSIDGYIGQARIDDLIVIPCGYELHPLLISQAVDVLLLVHDLQEGPITNHSIEKDPISVLAGEVAYIARDNAEAVHLEGDQELDLVVPDCILAHIRSDDLRRFYGRLRSKMKDLGYYSRYGSVHQELKIRRSR